ncbi:MAG: dTMP kinase [Armatimonadetes bacterium]|nr:dTMP kinase [Armatimonadota bacterium]
MFVTLEGPEGAGKSTVAAFLAERLEAVGKSVCLTREPGAGDVGGRIRSILLDGESLDTRCELFLFLADRSQHVAAVIRPALASGSVVLCDRFADSTIVYQGYGRGLDLAALRAWNTFATNGLVPDLTLLLDLSPEAGLARQTAKDRLDSEPIEFHRRVREGFIEEARLDAARWVVVDASMPPEAVASACWTAVTARLSP